MSMVKIITTSNTFNKRLNENQNKTLLKGGTKDGINHQAEYWGDFADALVYALLDLGLSDITEKVLKNFEDIFFRSQCPHWECIS